MSIMRLYRITSKARYKSNKRDMNGAVANHLLDIKVDPTTCKTLYERDFDTVSCNEKWSTNISEFHIASGKLYFSPILDLHNQKLVSYSISRGANFSQTLHMLNKAFDQHENLEGLILHSDQGWQYQMERYHTILQGKGIIQSMSRKGNCLIILQWKIFLEG